MKTNITFRKEIAVDLNEYYPKLSKRLREEIDNAIYAMLGGTLASNKKQTATDNRPSAVGAKDAVILRLGKKSNDARLNSKTRAVMAELKRMPGGEFLKDDVIKICAQHGMQTSSAVHHLVRGRYLEVVK